MTVDARVRRGRGFATRLVACVLLSAAVTGTCELTLAGRLADQSVLREGLAAATADGAAVQALSSQAADPWLGARQGLAALVARPGVIIARILDPDGSVHEAATAAGRPAAADPATDLRNQADLRGDLPTDHATDPATDPATRAQVRLVVTSGRPQPVEGGTGGTDAGRLNLLVPTRVDGQLRALQLVLDAAPAAARAAALRRALLLVLAAGTLAIAPLALALGGRRLISRYRRALQVADLDDLTGIGNRRAFRQALDDAVDDALDHGSDLSLLLVEIRGLGAVNGSTGRRRGDDLLTGVADSLVGQHPADLVFRTGGDGFAVLLPAVPADLAADLAARLADRLAVDVPPLTALVGVCGLDQRCPDAELLLIGADADLAEAKVSAPVTGPARVPAFAGAAGGPAGESGEPGEPAIEDVWDIRQLTGEGADGSA
jgi:diguanylate cyclase (GGDEF)-like protein